MFLLSVILLTRIYTLKNSHYSLENEWSLVETLCFAVRFYRQNCNSPSYFGFLRCHVKTKDSQTPFIALKWLTGSWPKEATIFTFMTLQKGRVISMLNQDTGLLWIPLLQYGLLVYCYQKTNNTKSFSFSLKHELLSFRERAIWFILFFL